MSSKPRFVGEKVKLGELCDVCSGGTPKRSVPEYWNEGSIPWVKISDISSKFISSTEEQITEAGLKGSSAKLLAPGTLLYSIFASIGAVGILKIPAATNQAIAGLSIRTDRIERDYLYHYLKSQEALAKSSGRGVAQNNINLTILRGMEIPVPAIDEQRIIVEQLEMVAAQIKQAETQLAKLDSLVKSRFVEMFEESDRYNGSVYRLADIGEIASGITKGRKARDKELFETPYLSTANVQAGRLDLSVIKTIDATMPEIEKFRLAEGDVLMTEGGDPDKVGRGAVAHNLPKNCIHQNHVFRVRLNRVILYPEYFEMFLQSPGCREYFFRASKQTTGIATINKTQLRNMQVLVPPIKAQEEFLAFASQVDKSRFIAQQQIEKLQMLYDSLVQDYFGD